MKALRVQVERVVRPIRAHERRKDRMREELLAHLTGMYDEELRRTGDEQRAAAEAIRRFGDAAALSGELQASIPALERWQNADFLQRWPSRRRVGESPVRYILRMHGRAMAICSPGFSVCLLIMLVANSYRRHRFGQPTNLQLILLTAGLFVVMFATMIGAALLSEAIRQALDRRAAAANGVERRKASWRVVGYVAASSGWIGLSFAAMTVVLDRTAPIAFITSAQFWWITAGAMVAGLPLTLLQIRDWRTAMRRFEDWQSLDLDEQQPA